MKSLGSLSSIALVLAAGCADSTSGGDTLTTIDSAVTDSAAAALADGHLKIALSPLQYPSVPSIDSIAAKLYASLYVAQLWDAEPSGIRSRWEATRGTPLELNRVRSCGPLRRATGSLATSDNLPAYSRRLLGEYWIVRFCVDDRETAGVVGVSAYSSSVSVVDGTLQWPTSGGFFQNEGLPPRFQEGVRFTPEGAAILAFQCTGQQVRAVPRLVPQYGLRVYASKWELVLKAPVWLRVGGTPTRVDTVYAGNGLVGDDRVFEGLLVASRSQPETVTLPIIDNMPPDSLPIPPDWVPQYGEIVVDRDPTVPMTFDSATCLPR
jgi:hypothetical protein